MCQVFWNSRMQGPPVCDNVRSVPKKPVVWIGSVWLTLPGGECDTRSWRSNGRITRQQAQDVLKALLDQLVGEHGKDSAVDSGFTLKSR